MTKYLCGHEIKEVFLNNNPLSFVAYLVWKDRTGYDGSKEECWECYCKRINKKRSVKANE